MYTVLIQSKQTYDCLQQFYPLFSESIDAGLLDACLWSEPGTTLDTSVPELYDLISSKKEWRAIIVCSEPEPKDTKHPATAINPFDYLENATREGYDVVDGMIKDSEIPLIRLVHLLGGLPAPVPQFTPSIDRREDKVPQMKYKLMENEEVSEERRAHAEWCETHSFDGVPPTEIIIIKARRKSVAKDEYIQMRSSWAVHTEADSSDFWQRNMYPHNCRFLTFDVEEKGVIRKQKDMFKLWTAVLLLARNNTDNDTLQAHRLYNLDIVINEKALAMSLQKAVNKLNIAKHWLSKSLVEDEKKDDDVVTEIPDYSVDVPVSFQLPQASSISFNSSEYGLTGGIGSDDFTNWKQYTDASRRELRTLTKSVDRTLDQAAGRLRDKCEYMKPEVEQLTEYQEEDMRNSLDSVYHDIFTEQEGLPEGLSNIDEELDEADNNVRQKIVERITGRQAAFAIALSCLAFAICLLPWFILSPSPLKTGLVIALTAAAIAVGGAAVLLTQRAKFIGVAKKYQQAFSTVLSELSHNATTYSDFFSSIASHMRGWSYLRIMGENRARKDTAYFFIQKHLKAIELFLEKIDLWRTAMHINVDLQSTDIMEYAEDIHDAVDYDRLYSLDEEAESRVPLNDGGLYIKSPFGFVDKLKIEREETYNDVNYN
ncbi:MAG: hypothetical protein LUG86_00250 [Oscillospiraceae bacterium]|nr:hypothetical protein [Oscillospiraceae bacterium]